MTELIRDSYRYWELIWALALKELKIRYKRSVLGFLWALLNPALLMIVLTLVFSTIMRAAALDVLLAVVVVRRGSDRHQRRPHQESRRPQAGVSDGGAGF